MSLLSRIFTWWNGYTVGTWLFTRRHGVKVGEDESGNVFYRSHDGRRRWVIFAGEVEASRVSPDWHGWLHHTFDDSPSERPLPRKDWERPHRPNLTGEPGAYFPPGSMLTPEQRRPAIGDYQPWTPE